MGILLGWIHQRRWFTIGAFALLLVGMLVGPPVSKGHLWWISLLAGLFAAVSLYEWLRLAAGAGRLPATMRVGLPLWVGAWLASSGFIFPHLASTTSWSFALGVGGFAAVGFIGVLILVFALVARERSSRGL